MFNFDESRNERQKNTNSLNARTPKGKREFSVGEKVVASHNLSTGDRSYCTVVMDIISINEEKTHIQVSYLSSWDKKENKTILFIPEYEFYSAPEIEEEESSVVETEENA